MATQTLMLDAPLEGCSIIVDPAAITLGFFEDLESNSFKLILNHLALIVVGGDLPGGTDREGLRKLSVDEGAAVMRAVRASTELPKR